MDKQKLKNDGVKWLVFFSLVILIMPYFVHAQSIDYSQAITYWTFDSNLNDSIGLNNLTGTYNGVVGKIGNGYSSSANNIISNITGMNSTIGTIDLWFKSNGIIASYDIVFYLTDSIISNYYMSQGTSSTFVEYRKTGTSIASGNTGIEWGTTWKHLVYTWNGTSGISYINNVLKFSGVTSTKLPNISKIIIGSDTSGNNRANIIIDNFFITNQSYTPEMVNQSYNNGNGLDFSTLDVPKITEIQNISFTSSNILNNNFYINNYSLEFNSNGTNYTTTNGSIILLNYNTSNQVNISAKNIFNHYDINYTNVNLSNGTYKVILTNILDMSNNSFTNTLQKDYFINDTINLTWNILTTYINTTTNSYELDLYKDGVKDKEYFTLNINTFNVSLIKYGVYQFRLVSNAPNSLTNTIFSAYFNVNNKYYNPCNETFTLNSTGVPIIFNYSDGYNVVNTSVKLKKLLVTKNYDEKLTLDYGDNTYNISISNELTQDFFDSNTNCVLTTCINNWVTTLQPCTSSLKLVSYTDNNNCPLQYDVPIDNGTYNDCSIPPNTDRNLWLLVFLIVIWIFLCISIIKIPLLVIPTFIISLFLTVTSNTYFGSIMIGLISVIVTIIFFIVSLANKK